MDSKIVPIRLKKKDLEIIDTFIEMGEFKDRSDFIRFSIKLAIIKLLEKRLSEEVFLNSNSNEKHKRHK
ncbi:MAG: hypothetical protein J7L47_02215 [Candidatus Odinarchaeota archaeon]|nr:hypothetical protein [Candidatus Odinarchaeota archaeon]